MVLVKDMSDKLSQLSCPISKSCKELWDDLEKEAKEITTPDGKDIGPFERNKRITAAYADMFLQNPKLQWAGAAAFASKAVGCSLQVADKVNKKATEITNSEVYDGLIEESWAELAKKPARATLDSLGAGNKRVFEDIYPIHRFYEKYGIDKLKACASARNPSVDKEAIDAFEKLEAGDVAGYMSGIASIEQDKILQAPEVLSNRAFAEAVRKNQDILKGEGLLGNFLEFLGASNVPGVTPMTASFSSKCRGGKEIEFKGDDFSDLGQRMDFVEEGLRTFRNLYDENPEYIKETLREISQERKQ
jgi:hypothetical protein